MALCFLVALAMLLFGGSAHGAECEEGFSLISGICFSPARRTDLFVHDSCAVENNCDAIGDVCRDAGLQLADRAQLEMYLLSGAPRLTSYGVTSTYNHTGESRYWMTHWPPAGEWHRNTCCGNNDRFFVCVKSDAGTCSDGFQNGDEDGPDCGGPSCAPCRCGHDPVASAVVDDVPTISVESRNEYACCMWCQSLHADVCAKFVWDAGLGYCHAYYGNATWTVSEEETDLVLYTRESSESGDTVLPDMETHLIADYFNMSLNTDCGGGEVRLLENGEGYASYKDEWQECNRVCLMRAECYAVARDMVHGGCVEYHLHSLSPTYRPGVACYTKNNIVPASECTFDFARGPDYRGDVATTLSGHKCQDWSTFEPHSHAATPIMFPNTGLDNGAVCRNPDQENMPWCYTMNPDVRWEPCYVGPQCPTCQSPPLPVKNSVGNYSNCVGYITKAECALSCATHYLPSGPHVCMYGEWSKPTCDINCHPGYTLNASSCILCKQGTFKSSFGNEACSPCAASLVSDVGDTACRACPPEIPRPWPPPPSPFEASTC